MDLAHRVFATGKRFSSLLSSWPSVGVEPRSRILCCGLSELALELHRSLGGTEPERVGLLAAALSLVTKVDDQVIDAPELHRGVPTRALRERTRAYLVPTVDALLTGRTNLPRCELAAWVGRGLRALERFDAYAPLVWRGLEVQVDAVATFTRHPSEVSLNEVEQVTTEVSAVWLELIATIGALPSSARWPTRAELGAFELAGKWIQRVDALADLQKDLGEGHRSSFPLHRLWAIDPNERDPERGILRHGIDRECVAPAWARAEWESAIGIGHLFSGIHDHLHGRYLARVRGEAA